MNFGPLAITGLVVGGIALWCALFYGLLRLVRPLLGASWIRLQTVYAGDPSHAPGGGWTAAPPFALGWTRFGWLSAEFVHAGAALHLRLQGGMLSFLVPAPRYLVIPHSAMAVGVRVVAPLGQGPWQAVTIRVGEGTLWAKLPEAMLPRGEGPLT